MSLFSQNASYDLRTDPSLLDPTNRIIVDPNDDENELDGLAQYRNGPEGFVKWCEENIRVPIQYGDAGVETWVYLGEMPDRPHPITNRSFKYFWEKQKETLNDALEMHNGHFKHRLIIFCEPRGDGKSYRAMLIQCWKFFCFPRQMIVLGANSKEQTKFVHFDIIRRMILNSPPLLAQLGKKNVQEKEIRMKNARGEVVSFVRPISTMQGIVSNITGFTFSEMFKMTNTTFFTELYGSTRNIPNALGVIDSTVSTKSHKLYHLFEAYREKKSPTLFFCYRYSKNADQRDYWNPNQTQQQLDSYQVELGPEDFDRFFKNTWESGQGSIITPSMIEATKYVGINGKLTDGSPIISLLDKVNKAKDTLMENHIKNNHSSDRFLNGKIIMLSRQLDSIEKTYTLEHDKKPKICHLDELKRLGDLYNTDWAIGAGVDRADPLKKSNDGARTIVTIAAKGLYNSRNVDARGLLASNNNPLYLYILLHLAVVPTSDIECIKDELLKGIDEFDGIDTLCSERWGMWDIGKWCEEQGIAFEPTYPTYNVQKDVFREFFTLLREGRVKFPTIWIYGSKGPDILREEMEIFTHDLDKRWFGSPEKKDPAGIQDDSMYATGYALFGMRNLTLLDFRQREHRSAFAQYYR